MTQFVLWQGDCLELMKKIPDKFVDMILCDLPYGTTACKWDSIIPLEELWLEYNRICKTGLVILTASQPFTSKLILSNIDNFRYCWVWKKEQGVNFLLAKKQPLKIHEDIAVFSKTSPIYFPIMTKGKPYVSGKGNSGEVSNNVLKIQTINEGVRYPTTIIECNRERGLHPTQKPTKLFEYLINTYTLGGQIVLDNCMGSGTTGVACLNTGRRFIGMELDTNYFQIAKDRIESHAKTQ